ncbi:PREDICTED: stress response protein nst1-like [Elephantulus edwardii]|uniref:stress response protein nst1-like n=1 Tax=Elephantulus edwardii TaxID=28737 RepID=UPI0003F0ECD6|nr:PREDICTED: stress response protein nst1-like [Elephantulus edwardii]
MKEAMVQAEEVAVEITKKLEKKEKKRLKKEKKQLAALALEASENNGTLEDQECEETEEKPKKKKKKKPQEAPQENGMEDQSSSALPKPKKKKSLSKELVNSDFEESVEPTVNAKVPKRKKSSSREEPEDPEEVANSVPKKKKKLSKEEPISSGPEEAVNKSTKKKKKIKKAPQKISMDIPWGCEGHIQMFPNKKLFTKVGIHLKKKPNTCKHHKLNKKGGGLPANLSTAPTTPRTLAVPTPLPARPSVLVPLWRASRPAQSPPEGAQVLGGGRRWLWAGICPRRAQRRRKPALLKATLVAVSPSPPAQRLQERPMPGGRAHLHPRSLGAVLTGLRAAPSAIRARAVVPAPQGPRRPPPPSRALGAVSAPSLAGRPSAGARDRRSCALHPLARDASRHCPRWPRPLLKFMEMKACAVGILAPGLVFAEDLLESLRVRKRIKAPTLFTPFFALIVKLDSTAGHFCSGFVHLPSPHPKGAKVPGGGGDLDVSQKRAKEPETGTGTSPGHSDPLGPSLPSAKAPGGGGGVAAQGHPGRGPAIPAGSVSRGEGT